MTALSMIDATMDATLRPYSHGHMTDSKIIGLSEGGGIPELLRVLQPTQAAQGLRIDDVGCFLTWLKTTPWSARFTRDLQCIAEDRNGHPLLTTWISLGEFQQLVTDAAGSAHGPALQQALDTWSPLHPDEIAFNFFKHTAEVAAA